MHCLQPLRMDTRDGGASTFHPINDGPDTPTESRVPFPAPGSETSRVVRCGSCECCNAHRAHEWATRVDLELRALRQLNPGLSVVFVTCSYETQHLGPFGGIRSLDITHFVKRIRDRQVRNGRKNHIRKPGGFTSTVEYFACEEYGSLRGRAHVHLILIGSDLEVGKSRLKTSASGEDLFTSPNLTKSWPFGFANFGSVTPASVSYTAGYTIKKLDPNGPANSILDLGTIREVHAAAALLERTALVDTKTLQRLQLDAKSRAAYSAAYEEREREACAHANFVAGAIQLRSPKERELSVERFHAREARKRYYIRPPAKVRSSPQFGRSALNSFLAHQCFQCEPVFAGTKPSDTAYDYTGTGPFDPSTATVLDEDGNEVAIPAPILDMLERGLTPFDLPKSVADDADAPLKFGGRGSNPNGIESAQGQRNLQFIQTMRAALADRSEARRADTREATGRDDWSELEHLRSKTALQAQRTAQKKGKLRHQRDGMPFEDVRAGHDRVAQAYADESRRKTKPVIRRQAEIASELAALQMLASATAYTHGELHDPKSPISVLRDTKSWPRYLQAQAA